jgi:hypothetical protein
MTIAQARENFHAAMEALRSSKVRSALTVLGIVIGVSSVISMAAIIQGLNKFVQERVESLGSRTYFISRFPPGTDPSRWPDRIRVRKYFEYNYASFIRDAAPDVQALTTIGTRGFFSVIQISSPAATIASNRSSCAARSRNTSMPYRSSASSAAALSAPSTRSTPARSLC